MLTNYKISLVNTRNPFDTAKLIFWTAKKEQEGDSKSLVFKVGKKAKDTKKLQEQIVASLPGISSVLSKRLLKKFGSLEKIFSAAEDELTEAKGVNKKLAKRIKHILGKRYR